MVGDIGVSSHIAHQLQFAELKNEHGSVIINHVMVYPVKLELVEFVQKVSKSNSN